MKNTVLNFRTTLLLHVLLLYVLQTGFAQITVLGSAITNSEYESAAVTTLPNYAVGVLLAPDNTIKVASWNVNAQGDVTHVNSVDNGKGRKVNIVSLTDNRVAVAAVKPNGKLRLALYGIAGNGTVSAMNESFTSEHTYKAAKPGIIRLNDNRLAVGLIRDNGNFEISIWRVQQNGNFEQQCEYHSGDAENIDLSKISNNRLVAAVRKSNSDEIRLIAFDFDSGNCSLQRRGDADAGGSINKFELVTLSDDRIAICYNAKSSKNLGVKVWDVNNSGNFIQQSTETGGACTQLSLVALAKNLLITQVIDSEGKFKLIAWKVSEGGALSRLNIDFQSSKDYNLVYASRIDQPGFAVGNNRLITCNRLMNNRYKIVCLHVNTVTLLAGKK